VKAWLIAFDGAEQFAAGVVVALQFDKLYREIIAG
jgi:hypothetical protein